jgi:glycosyltransferase involved in cell wall biosynthesis
VVSVCIPTYQGAEFLAACIASVLNQSFREFELIIVDDCSTDDTVQVAQRFDDSRIRLYRSSTNGGAEANWNTCLGYARGKYIKFLPQDDLLSPDCLSSQVMVLEADVAQELALVFCSRTVIDAGGKAYMTRGLPKRFGGRIPSQELIRRTVRAGTNVIGEPGAVLFRRVASSRVGRFDGSLGYVIDLDFWARLLSHGDAWYLPAPLASFRVSRASWSVSIGRGQIADVISFLGRLKNDERYLVKDYEFLLGSTRARLNTFLRELFYKIVLERDRNASVRNLRT